MTLRFSKLIVKINNKNIKLIKLIKSKTSYKHRKPNG